MVVLAKIRFCCMSKGKTGCVVEQELEEIRLEMNEKLRKGKIKEATLLRDKLEAVMEKSGFQYKPDESSL